LQRSVSTLAGQLARALATELEVRHAGRIEVHDGLGIHAAVLDDAKRQHVDAGLPAELGRGDFLRDHGIREARAIHVHGHATRVRDVRERADLRGRIHGAALGGLRDGQHARLHAVHVRFEPVEARAQVRGRHFCARTRHQRELCAPGEELRRTAFITLDVRFGMAQHGAPGRTERRERQRVRGGAGRHGEHAHLGAEEFPNTASSDSDQ
jgi:hypothetical protein